uniref:Transposase n=1 Tax=Globodera pallida TaxID=36090 RepID=A0A183BJ59_GLOPA
MAKRLVNKHRQAHQVNGLQHMAKRLINKRRQAPGTPYWEMVMKFPSEERKVVIQFCQWSDFSRLGQKMRMFLKKAEDTFVNRVDSLITENLIPIIGKNVCF